MADDGDKLYLIFHGRIIDSLGIQMYQRPVAAVAELIANAWDADANSVCVELPTSLSGSPTIVVRDDRTGMTFEECQTRYLDVGRNRRIDQCNNYTLGGRPLLGRKGIGKFAGFGIAAVLEVDTTSRRTGKRTRFTLDLNTLRNDFYVATDPREIPILSRLVPDDTRRASAGTTVTLRNLTLRRTPNAEGFAISMARRFLINQAADEFSVRINALALPEDNALMGVEFDFPTDHKPEERSAGLRIENGIGIESVSDDQIAWRVRFTKDTIDTEELRGVTVFCGIKVAQTPFFFNLSGGLFGQHGQQYMCGYVQADFLDQLEADIITTERQRINWEHDQARPIEDWGQRRIKSLLAIWKARRAEEKIRRIDN